MYEMIRRRCRTVVVIDGGCDPEFGYEDLGNALRKVRIDFGLSIVFDAASMAALREKKQRFAVARIPYGEGMDGVFVYIKPMLVGGEPPDVASYGRAHGSFPHESTGDQWFTEAQTESYRELGLYTVREVFGGVGLGTLEAGVRSLLEK